MATTTARTGAPAGRDERERQDQLRTWIRSLGPSAVVTFLTHDEYEREQRQQRGGAPRTAVFGPPVD